ncbi:hypothetical protein BU26DRAFT_66985 [Trematosphaeria pertusa]|uniref:Uncharacterized protein n=1 Tax=Trematosphaeria pertusa TaxID=390896 RepID=A0A6A6I489_9PLEO|nr:uncharacterized protein BU26DRAFT_66985 [Trematosphaeria pertusa]KAF2245324.1 hypothetical protein BU26DRAFT_66985 [Trematosphaeria pertusa]
MQTQHHIAAPHRNAHQIPDIAMTAVLGCHVPPPPGTPGSSSHPPRSSAGCRQSCRSGGAAWLQTRGTTARSEVPGRARSRERGLGSIRWRERPCRRRRGCRGSARSPRGIDASRGKSGDSSSSNEKVDMCGLPGKQENTGKERAKKWGAPTHDPAS